MLKLMRLLTLSLLLIFNLPAAADSQTVISRGTTEVLTADAFEAYYESLVFCLTEIGEPASFSAAQKQQMQQTFITAFPTLPTDTQLALANARATWSQYQQAWPILNLDQKKAFAFDVLSLAYGDAAAAKALGLKNAAASSGGGSSGGYTGGVPMTEDYSKAYGGGIDAGDGTYEFESYDSSTGSYGYSYE